jgi:Amt family ammonium transporter
MPENFNFASQMMAQLKAIGLTIVYSGIMTAVVYFISSLITGGGRVDDETELKGLDTETHGEEAINL